MVRVGRSSSQAQQKRRARIASQVIADGSISIEDIAARENVSTMTVYRDVQALEDMGLVSLKRGQVHALASGMVEAGAEFRRDQNVQIKQKLAAKLLPIVPEGSSVIVDDSTTALYALEALVAAMPLYVITNSLLVAQKVADMTNVTLQVIGGRFERWARAFTGSQTLYEVSQLHADYCFLSASGTSATACYHPYSTLAEVKKRMMQAAKTRVLLADHSKFARRSVYRFADFSEFEIVVTDDQTPPAVQERIRSQAGQLLVAD